MLRQEHEDFFPKPCPFKNPIAITVDLYNSTVIATLKEIITKIQGQTFQTYTEGLEDRGIKKTGRKEAQITSETVEKIYIRGASTSIELIQVQISNCKF